MIEEVQWHFCPYCGIEWEGEKIWDRDAWYKKQQLKHAASGGRLRENDFRVEYRYNWFPENNKSWSQWEWLQRHNFLGDEAFKNVERLPSEDDGIIPTKYKWYMNCLKFAKLVNERARINPPTCDFFRHSELFQVRVVRQTWKGFNVIDTKVLWESDVIRMKHVEELYERI
jgi:hypothetical protein